MISTIKNKKLINNNKIAKKEDILNFPLYMYVQDNLEEWFHDFTKELIERQIS